MVTPGPPDRHLLAAALSRVPDLPRWVDTRGMLLSGRALIVGAATTANGLVVLVRDAALASIVGRPAADVILASIAALSGDVNVLAQLDDAEYVSEVLTGWVRRQAIIHVLGTEAAWEREEDRHTHVFTSATAPRFDHLGDAMRQELTQALDGRTVARFVHGALPPAAAWVGGTKIPMAAAWADGRPVAFCYPVWQTERHWDVSVETWEPYQRQGFGARAARAMIRHLRAAGRDPVWGALESNTASRRLAARLGFIETAGIAVWTRKD